MGLQKSHRKISASCIILIIICTISFHVIHVTTATTTSDIETTQKIIESTEDNEKQHEVLEHAESKDGKAEIIKHIQRVNNDGTYTVGYEADDGTFKIESRDVLGNVKGTFGYVDSNGEIKRVSYTANNGTGLKNNREQTASEEQEIRENPKFNRTLLNSTTRRSTQPTASSVSSTTPTSRGTVIQTIPRRLRILTPSSTSEKPYKEYSSSPSISSATASKLKGNDPSSTIGTVVYATSVPTGKPYVNIRPTPLPGTNIRHQLSEQQISRPEKLEIDHHVSQVQISTNREASTSKPVTEDVDEKDEEKLIIRGSSLRRQLSQDPDANHLYGPSSGSIRNLPASLTSGQKIPALVLAARQRANQLQSSINSHVKLLEKTGSNNLEEPTTQSTSEHSFLTQGPVQDQIPANKLIHQNGEQENRVLRKSEHRPPQFIRIHPGQNVRNNAPQFVRIPLPQNQLEGEQYLRETTSVGTKPEEQDPVPVQVPQNLYYRRPMNAPPPPPPGYYYPSAQGQQQSQPPQQPIPPPQQSQNVQPQDQMTGFYPQASPLPYYYRGGAPLPIGGGGGGAYPYYNGYPERPLTTRDFERLLQLLVLRHQYLQTVSDPYGRYDPYYGGYQFQRPQIPPPLPYGPYTGRFPYRSIPPFAEHENMYQAQNQIPHQSEGGPPSGYELQRLMPRKKQYNPRYFGIQNNQIDDYGAPSQNSPGDPNYLPPDVREELLYRMLMLALQSEQSASSPVVTNAPVPNSLTDQIDTTSTTMKTTSLQQQSYRKPVRSVQILGEEK